MERQRHKVTRESAQNDYEGDIESTINSLRLSCLKRILIYNSGILEYFLKEAGVLYIFNGNVKDLNINFQFYVLYVTIEVVI